MARWYNLAMRFFSSLRQRFGESRVKPIVDYYHLEVVTSVEKLQRPEKLPLELRYVLAVRPSRQAIFRTWLENGYGIGIRSVEQTPEQLLNAVDRISRWSQENTVIPWLERLLRHEELPIWSQSDLESAEAEGVKLTHEAQTILDERYEFKKIVLVDLQNRTIGTEEQRLLLEINQDLYPLAIDTIVHRVIFDNAHARTEVAQSILKALIVVGPIAHVLEHVLSGLGKIFAASADDLLSETAELMALRGSGFTWRQLIRRSRILIPIFLLATYGAFSVDGIVHSGHPALAGLVFGVSAVALSLTTALQSIGLYRSAYVKLLRTGKMRLASGASLSGLALRQDFTNPARLGLFAGAFASPILAAIVFLAAPSLISNGWVLALLGSTESIVGGLTVIGASQIERLVFRLRVRRALANVVSGMRPRQEV